MPCFFRSDHDLFLEIMKGADDFLSKSMLALDVVGRRDLQDDVKDAVVSIASSDVYEDAAGATSSLMSIFEDGFGVFTKIDKRN